MTPAHAPHFDPILRPDLAEVYAKRAIRLQDLASGHDLEQYLRLAAALTTAQAECLAHVTPLEEQIVPVNPVLIAGSGAWLPHLAHILDAADKKRDLDDEHYILFAVALTEGRFDVVDPSVAPFIWAALSVEVARLARGTPLPPPAMAETTTCPICGTAPVASVIYAGDRQGLRYLHCALCECEWHMVRAKCSNCGDSKHVDYLSFDTTEATVRSEACGACGGYLKIVSQERDHQAEVVADDLATLILDDASVAEGFQRSGFNPWALPG